MNPLVLLLIQEAPALIEAAKGLFATVNPDVPEPTSEEVLAAFEALFHDSIAIDDFILAAHAND